MMHLTRFLSKSRGIRNLAARVVSIVKRFGLTSGKFARMLERFNEVTSGMDCVPTFAITAVVLKRHANLARKFSRNGAEFAVHGYIHTDYGVLPYDEQVKHFVRAIGTFAKCQVRFTGFRAPFLRTNGQTCRALSQVKFAFDSSRSIAWDVLDRRRFSDLSWREYQRLLEFYRSADSRHMLSLPYIQDGLVEIPVSIPDDEALVERLGITDRAGISAVWKKILWQAHASGELFTLQLHPERIFLCDEALADILQEAQKLDPPVWVATLREIAAWWQQKQEFSFELIPLGNMVYRIRALCPERATVLVRNCEVNTPSSEWFDGYRMVALREFILKSQSAPFIGVSKNTSPEVFTFLQSEGYIVTTNGRPDNCAFHLEHPEPLREADKKLILEKIESSGVPILRYWRWPDGSRSTLSVTGDIDSITLKDFALRILENWYYNLKYKG